MNKQISVGLLILLLIGQVHCSFWEDLQTGGIISVSTTAAVTIGSKVGLTLIGFSSTGPVAGTIAAATQATIGNVVAGSAFACAQSLAMSGIAVIAGPATVAGVAAGVVYMVLK